MGNDDQFCDTTQLCEAVQSELEIEIDDNSYLIRCQRRGSFLRSQGVRNLSLVENEEHVEKNCNSERSTLLEFVQNINRRMSRTKETLEDESIPASTSSNNASIVNIEYSDGDFDHDEITNSLRFYYNFDMNDDHSLDETTTRHNNYEEKLPEIFNDGNFELVDGLITLIEKPVQKNFNFLKCNILPNANASLFQKSSRERRSSQPKRNFKPRAA